MPNSNKALSPIVEEIQSLLNPVREKATIVVIVMSRDDNKSYSIFGNLTLKENKELVRVVAADLCLKEIDDKIGSAIALIEKAVSTVN